MESQNNQVLNSILKDFKDETDPENILQANTEPQDQPSPSSSSLPLAFKWSLSISLLISMVMGILGWFLISQQERSFRLQTEILGQTIVQQLARSASEPLMADDELSLQVLVRQLEKNDLMLGIQLFTIGEELIAGTGVSPAKSCLDRGIAMLSTSDGSSLSEISCNEKDKRKRNSIFLNPVKFQDVVAGYAVITLDKRPLEENLKALTNALFYATLGLIGFGIILSVILANRLSRPIYRLVEAGEALHRGEADSLGANHGGDEMGQVFASFRKMADGLEQKRHVEREFTRFLPPKVAKQVLADESFTQLGGITVDGTVLFCDVVGFTELSEGLSPEEVAELLNAYFRYFSVAGSSCQGTIDKFIGDCVMMLFGIPEQHKHHGLHAVTCAVLIQAMTETINIKRKKAGLPTVQFRIGINSGQMLAGNLGSETRMQYTVVGDAVNVASRLSDLADPQTIMLTEETAQQPGVMDIIQLTQMDTVHIRGRQKPIIPYGVDASTFSDQQMIDEVMENIFRSDKETEN